MNRLVIIGNGFDIAHNLKTSYKDFYNWYLEQILDNIIITNRSRYTDSLCELFIPTDSSWYNKMLYPSNSEVWKTELIQDISTKTNRYFTNKTSTLFNKINKSINEKRWVDIENDYYSVLLRILDRGYDIESVNKLNSQLGALQDKLVEYLSIIDKNGVDKNSVFEKAITEPFNCDDFSTENLNYVKDEIITDMLNGDKSANPYQIMLLSFNYTRTIGLYTGCNIIHNYIHGKLDNPGTIIFGYGDELDNNYHRIIDMNNNDLLRNVKSIKYLEADNYRRMLVFLQSAPFQVYIMGHSCGNSDRTLLNTIFEHKNCYSIKPFYHKLNNNSDNFLELVQNISRNFTDMKLFRDRVVNKKYCKTI